MSHEGVAGAYVRSYIYVGGEYIKTSTGHIFQNQMYVERLTPPMGPQQPYPIIFIHGNCQSGTNWLNKPDGGAGWASWFVQRGYQVFLVDQPHVGRSARYPESEFRQLAVPAEFIEQRFTAPAKYMIWPQAALHMQWPGTGVMGDPIFDAYYASNVPTTTNSPEQERTTLIAGTALLDKIGPAILIARSQGSLAGWSWTDSRPDLVKALIQIEPKGPPFREVIFSNALTRPWGLCSIPLAYDPPPPLAPSSSSSSSSTNTLTLPQNSNPSLPLPLAMQIVDEGSQDRSPCILQTPPARQLIHLPKIPILIVTAEASYHSMYDHCFVEFLRQAGCVDNVEHYELAKMGIRGNGHMMFMERNSDEIAEVLEGWIVGKVGNGNVMGNCPKSN